MKKQNNFDHLYFFGRFNFAHFGYLYVIRETLNQLHPKGGLTVVFSTEHATWNKQALPMLHRQTMFSLAMTQLLPSLQSQIHLSSIEEEVHQQMGEAYKGYAIDILQALVTRNSGKTGIVMGADAALGIPGIHPGFTAWKDWEEDLKLAELIIVPRGRFPTKHAVETALPVELVPYAPLILETHPSEIELHASSTAISQGKTAYLPALVYAYALQNHLLVQ